MTTAESDPASHRTGRRPVASALPLRGRSAEFGLLSDGVESLLARQGSSWLITGGPGSGKSRLLDELARSTRPSQVRILRMAGDPDGRAVTLGPMIRGGVARGAEVLDWELLRRHVGRADEQYWLLQELESQLERASQQTPLAILFDDLQWSDELTLLAMRTLPERLHGSRIMWVLGSRSNSPDGFVRQTLNHLKSASDHHLQLAPLSEAAVTAVANDVLQATPSKELLELMGSADGQPLMLMELLRALVEHGAVLNDAGVATLATDATVKHYGEQIVQRLDRLPNDSRLTAQVGAVIGREFSAQNVRIMMQFDPERLRRALASLVGSGLVTAHDETLRFTHDLVRESIELTIPRTLRNSIKRQVLDLRLAGGVPVEDLALDLLEIATKGDESAIALLRQAAADKGTSAPKFTSHVLRQALSIAGDDFEDKSALTAAAIAASWRAGEERQARDIGEDALVSGLSSSEEAKVRLELAVVAGQHSFSEAIRHCTRAMGLPGVSAALRARLGAILAVNLSFDGKIGELPPIIAEGLRSAIEAGDDAARALLVLQDSFYEVGFMNWEAGIVLADQAVGINGPVPYNSRLWATELWRSYVLVSMGQVDRAIEDVDRGLLEATEHQHAMTIRMFTMMRARVLIEAGRIDDARAEAEASLQMGEELDVGNFAHVTAGITLSQIALLTGDPGELRQAGLLAREMIESGTALVTQMGFWVESMLLDARGDSKEAGVTLRQAMTHDPMTEPTFATCAVEPSLVRIFLAAGDQDGARRVASGSARRAARNPDVPTFVAISTQVDGLMRNDASALARAAAMLRGSQLPLLEAGANEDAGIACAAADRLAALAHFSSACETYETVGAARHLKRVEGRLRALGVKPRSRGGASRWLGLTPSEEAVVRLIAGGTTNREAASALALSPHTVSTHLRHAFKKFDITSRAQLAAIVVAAEREQAPRH